ncbi:RDD family protein [Campylobacter sp. MIT 21-1685]|uniref:RDD family protein n=1 Tax=unclassified Campylobacter TaxID=2593542 RepID=UPI00224AE8EA|nr:MULTISPECIES: RDD family protein [unclassified Campylobacter]MCX2682520.1 RDD family protein [Campylobacter sp. MIT 21-1684]MCX2750767.1 RDD family protein [Campylobacter sp. MIT 21-1682]MCX2807001.1 RDD family protein [Campylobacter sp. MIT 21-1685]
MKEDLTHKLERENLKIASFTKRMVAYIIDNLILSCIVFVIFYDKFAIATDLSGIDNILRDFVFGSFLLHFSYHTLFTFIYGASLGKMLCKIIILDENLLDKPTFLQSCIRAFVRELSSMAFMLGFVWALGNNLRKTWQDYAARTIVIDVA